MAYPPGGLSDGVARALAERLAAALGVPVLVENRAGAGGAVGMEAVARAAPDGFVIGFCAISPLAMLPHVGRLGYDPVTDVAPVASIMLTPALVVGTPAFAGRTFEDLVALARARPGRLRWATSGPATIGHLVLEQVRGTAIVDIVHVPYKGGGQQLSDALAGHFEVLSTNLAATQLQHVRSGRLTALAVGAPARVQALPDLPTLAELGFPDANLASLFGVFAPGRTPERIVMRLNAEIQRVLAEPAFRQRLLDAENIPVAGSPADFARRIAAESRTNARVVRAARIRLD